MEQLARPSGHLASNLLIHRARQRQLARRDAQDRGFRIDRVGARTPAHDVRGAGYVHEARDEASPRQRFCRRDRQAALRQIRYQVGKHLITYCGHSPHRQASSAPLSSSPHVSRASRTAADATDGEYPLRTSMELSLR